MGMRRQFVRAAARRGRPVAAGLAAALLALAGCGGGDQPTLPATCPRVGILADAADLTHFRPGAGQDLSAMVLDARITGFQARCDYTRRGRALEMILTVQFAAERGPAAQGARTAELPYFVTVVSPDETQVIAPPQHFSTRVVFPTNVSRVRANGQELSIVIPLGGERRLGDEAVLIAFQLTPEELALNRRRGPR
jgi:hypothetical protein